MGWEGGATGWVGAAAVDTLGMVVVMVEAIEELLLSLHWICVDAWWCGCENVSCHLSFDLSMNFKFRLRPGVYFLALGLSL